MAMQVEGGRKVGSGLLEAARLAAELEAARARAAETKRLQDEGTRKAAEEAAGQERLKDVRENQSWLEQYGPLVGYPLGFQSALGRRAGLSAEETAPLNGKARSRGGR